jgi:glucans biosynthesis protein C
MVSGVETRLHYMDNLRALAMLAGVVFHAGLAYSVVIHPFWPTADASNTMLVDAFVWFTHLFRMPLFFVVAGFFVALLVAKRGVGGMLQNRFARVMLPFILFWPIVYLVMGWLFTNAAAHNENLSPLLAYVKPWLTNPDRPRAMPTLMHLWFLPYLMCFCVLVWVAIALDLKAISNRFAKVHPGLFIFVGPLLLVVPLITVAIPFPAPDSFFPQWWALVFFGTYFAFGFQLHRAETTLDKLRPYVPSMLFGAAIGYAAFFWLLQAHGSAQASFAIRFMQAALEAYTGVWLTLCCLTLGKAALNKSNHLMRYIADASYWIYIVHLPILFAIQYPLLDVAASWPAKFAFSVAVTLIVSFLSYHVLVRRTFIGRLLNGSARASKTSVSRALTD